MAKVVFLISGQLQNGKDSLADAIEDALPLYMKRSSFAAPLKQVAMELLGMPEDIAYGSQEVRLNWTHPAKHAGRDLNAREWLQWIGGELGRRMIHEDIWVDRCVERIKTSKASVFLITDGRHANEILDLQAKLGNGFRVVKIRVKRPGFENHDPHPSEAEQMGIPDGAFDEIVINDFGLAELNSTGKILVKRYVPNLVAS